MGAGAVSTEWESGVSSAESAWLFGIREFVAAAAGVAGGLALEIDGELVEIGGVGEESVTVPSDNGMTILADLDGDGIVDHVAAHGYSGGFEVWSRSAEGAGWGIPAGDAEKPAAGWGLESEVTPIRGRETRMDTFGWGRWICIDRG